MFCDKVVWNFEKIVLNFQWKFVRKFGRFYQVFFQEKNHWRNKKKFDKTVQIIYKNFRENYENNLNESLKRHDE